MYGIVCMGTDGGIGKDGDLIYHFKDDMRFFKDTTKNKVVVMGRKTYDSLPNGPLPDRINIVLTHRPIDNPFVISCTEENIHGVLSEFKNKYEIYVIGGEQIYKMFLPDIKVLYATIVFNNKPADSFFPIEVLKEFQCKDLMYLDPKLRFNIIEFSARL